MPIIESAKKQMRVSRKNQVRNYRVRRDLKEAIKAVILVVKEGKKEEAAKALQKAYKVIDTSAKKYLLHPNNAARKKSSLAKMVANMGDKPVVVATPGKKKTVKAKAKVEKAEKVEETEESEAAAE